MASLEMSKYLKSYVNKCQLNTDTLFFNNGNLWIHGLQDNLKRRRIYSYRLTHGCHWNPTLQNVPSIMPEWCRHSSGEDSQFSMWATVNSPDRDCSVLLSYYIGNDSSYMLTVLNSTELTVGEGRPLNMFPLQTRPRDMSDLNALHTTKK